MVGFLLSQRLPTSTGSFSGYPLRDATGTPLIFGAPLAYMATIYLSKAASNQHHLFRSSCVASGAARRPSRWVYRRERPRAIPPSPVRLEAGRCFDALMEPDDGGIHASRSGWRETRSFGMPGPPRSASPVTAPSPTVRARRTSASPCSLVGCATQRMAGQPVWLVELLSSLSS